MRLGELAEFYWEEIAPVRRRQGYDPETDRPAYAWLAEHGFGGIQYALREHHDLTVTAFFEDVVGVSGDEPLGFEWGIDHERTREVLDAYLSGLPRRQGLRESTIESKRARLAKYVRTYARLHGEADLLAGVEREATRPSEIERVLAALDAVGEELSTDASRLQYLGDVRGFYAHLQRRGYAAYDPLADASEEFPWERAEPDNQALDAADVRALYRAADAPGERLLVVGLAGWGLRPSELAGLHRDQVQLAVDDPHLAFEERKNGPGTVALIYGLAELAARLDDLAADPDWNGHLFPSGRAASGHVVPGTLRDRFERLAERADVAVDGGTPTPKMGRRFWYSTYVDASAAMLEQIEAIAGDQGSASPEVVLRNYLSEARRRELRQRFMRSELAAAFERG